MGDAEGDFEAAAALLEGGEVAVGMADVVPDPGVENGFDAAAAILAQQPRAPRLGFGHRTPASAAYARKCLEAQRSARRADVAESKLQELTQRLLVSSLGRQIRADKFDRKRC